MVTCATCGQESPDGFRFCGNCGSALLTDAGAGQAVRKTITVLFCDLVGSTALGERLDPESTQRVLGQYFQRVREVLERHQGTVEKYVGDAVVGVFGVPRLHEDDALRAVRAAAELAGWCVWLIKTSYLVTSPRHEEGGLEPCPPPPKPTTARAPGTNGKMAAGRAVRGASGRPSRVISCRNRRRASRLVGQLLVETGEPLLPQVRSGAEPGGIRCSGW